MEQCQKGNSEAARGKARPTRSRLRLSHSPVTTPLPHFFKIILHSTLEDKRLRIPDKFVRKFEDELLDVAEVVTPSGDAWKMGLTKEENNVWFDDGWQEFVEHHSIGYGHLLVFRYRGFSNFFVLIFDKTACEMQYTRCGPNADQAEKGDDDSVEIVGSANSCPCCSSQNRVFVESGKKGESSKMHNQNLGMNKRGRRAAFGDSPKFEHFNGESSKKCVKEEHLDVEEPSRGNLNNHGISFLHGPMLNESKSSLDENVFQPKCKEHIEIFSRYADAPQESQRAIQAARMFKTENPSFMIMLRECYIYKSSLYVPAEFAHRYLSTSSRHIKLQGSDGREWPAKITNGSMRLSSGWREFCKEYNLEEGDVCVLELIQKKNAVLKVSIFRAVKDTGLEH